MNSETRNRIAIDQAPHKSATASSPPLPRLFRQTLPLPHLPSLSPPFPSVESYGPGYRL